MRQERRIGVFWGVVGFFSAVRIIVALAQMIVDKKWGALVGHVAFIVLVAVVICRVDMPAKIRLPGRKHHESPEFRRGLRRACMNLARQRLGRWPSPLEVGRRFF